MRRTKAWFELHLDGAITFQLMPILYCTHFWPERVVRGMDGFVSACKYGYGQVPLPGEIGRTNTHRYISQGVRHGPIL